MIDELFSQNKKILLRKDLTFLFSISISGLGWVGIHAGNLLKIIYFLNISKQIN
jgi:hypothetical protein